MWGRLKAARVEIIREISNLNRSTGKVELKLVLNNLGKGMKSYPDAETVSSKIKKIRQQFRKHLKGIFLSMIESNNSKPCSSH